ncbi:MAG: RtcB family protein [Acidobacteriota bacterium]
MVARLDRVGPGLWQVAPTGGMLVPARVYASERLLETARGDESIEQACNVAHLPGIVRASLAMPDVHEGYGFPIGGVAAFRMTDGVISPGGVGYDINCGVRLVRTDVRASELGERIGTLVHQIQRDIPAGVGSEGAIPSLGAEDLDDVLRNGSAWAVARGYGEREDLDHTEADGCLGGADPTAVSRRARERGATQMGTLGSGNHFAEIQVVEQVLDQGAAQAFGLEVGAVALMIHSGSRGLGYQVCDDALDIMRRCRSRSRVPLPDPQLVSAPVASAEGRHYLAAMRAAANFAWANRQVMMVLAVRAMTRVLGGTRRSLGVRLVYDVAHNIAKLEEHTIDDRRMSLLVHRKGATRAFPAGHPEVPLLYREVGQPVLIPGDMGRASFVCVGTARAMAETFGSAAHGAGRVLSRTAARRLSADRDVERDLASRGVIVAARSRKTLAEEVPEAYKDAGEVVAALNAAGIARPVARLRPLGVVKG